MVNPGGTAQLCNETKTSQHPRGLTPPRLMEEGRALNYWLRIRKQKKVETGEEKHGESTE